MKYKMEKEEEVVSSHLKCRLMMYKDSTFECN